MEKSYKTLDELMNFLEKKGVNSRVLARIPDTLLFSKMKKYGLPDKQIISLLNVVLNGKGGIASYREHYENAIEKIEILIEHKVPYTDICTYWFDKECSTERLERMILRRYNTRYANSSSYRNFIPVVS